MAVICVNTSSPEFKGLLEKTHFSEGTLKSIIHEYQNTPSLWEGKDLWPSEQYVMNYFNRRFIGSPAQIAIWNGRFTSPHVYDTSQAALTEKQEAAKWFNDDSIMVYQNAAGKWVVKVARPLDNRTIKKMSDTWLQDLQRDINATVNTGAYGRYIPNKSDKDRTVPAMDYLGKRLDNFYRQRGLKVEAYFSTRNKKWMVRYAKEEAGYVDDISGGITDWTEGQKNAIDTLLNFLNNPNSGRYMLLEGAAGTGKTTLINEVLKRLNKAGRPQVLIGALSHKAKGVLDSKITKENKAKYVVEAKSLAGMLGMKMVMKNVNGNWQEVFEVDRQARKMGIPIQSADIVFIDEASMVSEEAMSYIEELVGYGTKIVFLGDQRQLPPIRTGGTEFYNRHPEYLQNPEADSPVFTRTDIPRVSLTERVRQGEDSPIHAVTDQFGNYTLQGGEFPSLSNTESSKDLRLIVENPQTNLVQQMLPLFQEGMKTQNPNFAKIVAFTNANVNMYNRMMHYALHPEMAASNDMNFAEGDLITLYDSFTPAGAKAPSVYNAEEGIVIDSSNTQHMTTRTGADIRYRDYTLKMQDGRTVTIPVLEQDSQNTNAFKQALEQLKKQALANPHMFGAWRPYYELKESMADMRMGYASTIHKSQGSTYQVVGVDTTDNFGSPRFKSQAIYTAMTRAANISIIKGMGSQNAAPTAEAISQANTEQINRRKPKPSITEIRGLSQEQIDQIHAETEELTAIIKQALKTVERLNYLQYSDIDQPLNTVTAGTILDAVDVLRMVATSTGTSQEKALAKAIIPLFSKMNIQVLFDNVEDTTDDEGNTIPAAAGTTWKKRQDGGYDVRINLRSRKIRLNPTKTVLHELVHALTTNRLDNDAEFNRGVTELMEHVSRWLGERGVPEISDWGKVGNKYYKLPRDIYGMYNTAEFFAEAMSNPYFQEVLKNIPAPETTSLSTWQKLCKVVADAFNSLLHLNFKKQTSVYDMLIPVIADTMTVTAQQYDRTAPFTEWDTTRTEQMMNVSQEIVKALNVAIEDKDVHQTTEQKPTQQKTVADIVNDYVKKHIFNKDVTYVVNSSTMSDEDLVRWYKSLGEEYSLEKNKPVTASEIREYLAKYKTRAYHISKNGVTEAIVIDSAYSTVDTVETTLTHENIHSMIATMINKNYGYDINKILKEFWDNNSADKQSQLNLKLIYGIDENNLYDEYFTYKAAESITSGNIAPITSKLSAEGLRFFNSLLWELEFISLEQRKANEKSGKVELDSKANTQSQNDINKELTSQLTQQLQAVLTPMGNKVHDLADMQKYFQEHHNVFDKIQQAVKGEEMDDIKAKAIANGTFMKAPNGKPTNLTEQQWLQVRTKAFKNWFGDWENNPKAASKVVDENGEPLVVYHFTDDTFTTFKDSINGLHFTPDSTGKNIFDPNPNTKKVSMPVFLNIKDPGYEWNRKYWINKEDWDRVWPYQRERLDRNSSAAQVLKIRKEANSKFPSVERILGGEGPALQTLKQLKPSVDGIVRDQGDFIVYNPNQIKSATNNNGMFSIENSDIQMFMTSQGEIYGFVAPNGDIYLDETKISPEHPIHEYTHLWDRIVAKKNPKLWKRGIELMKHTSLWKQIADDVNYGAKWGVMIDFGELSQSQYESLIASEVHARLVGEDGQQLLNNLAKEKGTKGIINKLKQWILDFWKDLKATFSNFSDDEIQKLTLNDFNHMTMRDFADAVNFAEAPSFSETPTSNNTPTSYEGIITPDANTIFVFGSNPEGRHGAGAAKTAREKFGAIYGQGEGLQGNAYALPTKDLRVTANRGLKSISPEQITKNIRKMYEVARQNSDKQFKVAYTHGLNETSLNGYTGAEMIKMFKDAGPIPENVIFSKNWTDHWNEVQSSTENQQSAQSSPSTGDNRTVVKKGDTIKVTTTEGRTFNAKIVGISPRINGFSLEYTDPADGFNRVIESDINGNPVDFSAKHYASVTDTNNNPVKLLETPKVEPTKEELFKEALKDTLDRINWLEGQISWIDNRIRYNQATSEDYNNKEEWERKLASEQALVDAAQKGKAEVFVNEHGTPFLRVLPEKPAPNIVVEDVFNFTETESQKEGYSKAVIISKKNMKATAKDGAAQMQRLIEQDRWPAGTQIIPRGLNNSELAALNRVKNLNRNEDGSWTVYYTEREMGLRRQNDTLLKNPLFGSHELHKLAALTMFKLSETITQLQSGEVSIEDILMDASLNNDLLGMDFTKMDRIEILNTIGLDKLFKDVIREQIFNADINERLQEDFDLADKAQVIYDNFDAFIRLGYQELINLENMSVETEDALKETDKKKDEEGEDLTDEEVVALFGSTVEHWQVGFRQVSTFTSLSKLIRQELNRIYVLDKDGNRVTDEYGIEQNIDAHEAVSKILKWTQGATSIEDMLSKLDSKIPQEPWVQQLTDMLRADGNEQLRSQFFSNFKKYFQKYNIIYKEKTNTGTVTRVKTINRDPFVISTLDMISSLDNSKEMGSFNLWDARKGQIDSNAIKAIGFGVTSLEALLNYKKSGWQMDSDLLQQHVEFIERALDYLNIPMPSRSLMLQTLDSASVLNTLYNAVKGLYDTFKSVPVNKADYKFMNSKTQSNYTRIVEAFAPVMGDGLDSVSYEAGKLHYSYVTPSYLSKFVENMKGMRGDVKAFIESEYGNIEGWFRNKRNNTNQAGGEGWLNYWLDRMMGDTEEAKNTRNKFDHVVVLSDDGTAYVAKSPVQYMSSMLSMYFYDDHGASAYYRIPMMSNKPSEEYIKFDRIRDNFKEVITNWLVNKTYAQELNRIRAVNFRNHAPAELEALRKKVSEGKTLTEQEASRKAELEEIFKDGMPAKISGFDTNGATFMFMEYLNQYVTDSSSELGKLLRKQINGEKFDESINESARFSELLREAVQSNLDSRFEGFLQNLAQEGLIQLSPSNEVIKVNTLQDKLPQSRAKGLLEEFFWNDMFASINLMQLLSTDIAYYKDTEDLQKRFAQWHSPGLRGDVNATINGKAVTDGNTRSMYIADRIEPSEIVETLKEVKRKVLAQERFTNNPPAKALMEAQLDKIIDAFKDVNVTDAQAYTSPTGYRKKMAVFGQWSPRDEEVYQKVISGNFTADDLDVLWQPLKPFVYSQIEKRGFNPFMPTLKMGVQQKNSEYCIILADALMRSVGMESKLTAIFDFMEESHKRHPNKGIDTIMFNSAVKAGLMGVIDINDPNLSHDDVVNYLNSMAGIGQDNYDDRYVHTIPFDDYSIQQYNPAHFEGEQQAGSQNRVLVFADMPNEIDGKEQTIVVDGNKVSVKQAKINYFKAIIDNIRISADGIREEFALDSKSKQAKRIALMRVLQKEIAKDARYGTDLQWACLLDDTCNFNIPLSDAIQSDRIQQLLNSIIKNRINKQEIAGGPVVQVSNYGTSKDLRIVRNEDGTIKYFECYAPVYDPQLYEDFGDGKGGIDMEKIKKDNPKLLEMIGYRIPTEAKYSMAPLKIVGFLPRNAGEGIMLPKEITTLSGSDFDVDKMYIMRYKLDRYDNKEQVIKEIEDEYKAAKQNGRASRVRGLVEGTIKPTQESDYIILASWRQKHKVEYRDYTSGKYYNDNLIIATQWGILTSGMAEDQVLSSGNFDEVKRIGYMMAAMDNGTPYDSASTMSGSALKKAAYRNKYLQYADTQMQFHKQNMVAAKLIGVFAQANVSHAIVGMSDVPAEIQIPDGGSFSINGQSYFSGRRYIVDQEYGLDNATRISSVLAQLLAGSVDAVKDPVLNLLNINMDTVNIAVTLVRLGHDLEFIGLFLTHPIIKQLVSRYNIEKASGSTNSLMQTLVAMQKELQGEDGKGATLQMKYNYDKAFFVREHTNWTATNDEQRKYKKDMDLTVLELFKKLNNMAEMFRGVVHTTRYNSITSAVGPYASDTMNNKIKDESFDANPFVTDELKSASEGIIYDEKGNVISLIRAFRDTSAKLERELLGENIIQASNATYEVYRALYRKMGYMSSKMAKEFGRFYMSYYMNMESPLFDLSDVHREEILDKFPLEFVAKKNQYRDNPFVQAVMLDKDKAGNDLLTINTRGLTDAEIQALRSSWADLYTSEKEKGIADKDNLALKLVEYNFFLGSFGFSPKTFMSMTPNVVKLAISGYKDSLTRDVVMNPDRIDNLLMQFMLNYGYTNLGTLKEKDISFKSGDLVDKKEFDREPTSAGIAKMQMNDGTTQWLYVEPITNSPDVRVYFVDKLGGNNQQCFEIDPSRKVYQIESIVKNIEPVSATEAEPDRGESAEPMVDDGRTVYQHLIPLLAAVKDGYIMDNPRQNMSNLQDRFNKLYNAGQQSFISSVTGLNMATIDRVADVLGVTQDALLSDVNESQNKLNLCK